LRRRGNPAAHVTASTLPRIVIVGGGAGGLELASRLGRRLGRRSRARVTLVDAVLTHLWKPLLHEVAAGTLNSYEDALEYLAQARWRRFEFLLGRFHGLDRENKVIHLASTLGADDAVIIPERSVPYDLLVLAIGSVTNDFGIPGVREYCSFLDDREQADRFQQHLLETYMQAQTQGIAAGSGLLNVAIVGAGATGVELAAELHYTAHQFVAYGFDRIVPEKDVKLTLIEAADRILPALPSRISEPAERELRRLNVEVYTNKRVTRVTPHGLYMHDGMFVHAALKVWAAGIKAPDFLKDIDGLETNRLNQLVVRRTLQTTRDDDVFALGDCSSCPRPGHDRPVPPTAQAAHQQASMLSRALARRLANRPLPEYTYRDYGSLVSLSEYTTVGNLMGKLMGDIWLEGLFARILYRSLYRLHQRALFGAVRTLLLTVADFLTRPTRARTKLH
jgi:NADH:quinone reductase (non-electrogenic)